MESEKEKIVSGKGGSFLLAAISIEFMKRYQPSKHIPIYGQAMNPSSNIEVERGTESKT